MVRVFNSQKTEQLIKKLELTQLSNHLQEKINHNHHVALSTIKKIENLSNIWQD